jgi:hypothetical protein
MMRPSGTASNYNPARINVYLLVPATLPGNYCARRTNGAI